MGSVLWPPGNCNPQIQWSKPSFLFGNKRKIYSCQYYWLMSVSQFRIELLYLSIRNGNMESVH